MDDGAAHHPRHDRHDRDDHDGVRDDALACGLVVGGRYVVQERVGRGGTSDIYRVEHAFTGEQLAMKVLRGGARLDPDALARFSREARAPSRIASEHVVRVTDGGTAPELGGGPFLVMELLAGVDLETFAERQGPLPPNLVARMVAQVASVLTAAHALGIVHRDLKPENMFLHERTDGAVVIKVLDFGIAKFLEPELARVDVTSTGAVLGTPLYMAPEQAHGQNERVSAQTDIWALGLVVVRLMAGAHYWGRPTMAELMTQITALPIAPPSAKWKDPPFSSALDAWFLKSCARAPEDRWTSVEEQLERLGDALGLSSDELRVPLRGVDLDRANAEVPSRTATTADRPIRPKVGQLLDQPRPRRRFAILGLAAVAAVAIVPYTLARLWGQARSDATPAIGAEAGTPLASGARATSTAVSEDGTKTAVATAEAPRPALSDPAARADAAAVSAASDSVQPARSKPPPVEPVAVCPRGQVPSLGHCCPPAHVWQSGRCLRPIATAF